MSYYHIAKFDEVFDDHVDSSTMDQIVSATIHNNLDNLQQIVTASNTTQLENTLQENINKELGLGHYLFVVVIDQGKRVHFDLFIRQ